MSVTVMNEAETHGEFVTGYMPDRPGLYFMRCHGWISLIRVVWDRMRLRYWDSRCDFGAPDKDVGGWVYLDSLSAAYGSIGDIISSSQPGGIVFSKPLDATGLKNLDHCPMCGSKCVMVEP